MRGGKAGGGKGALVAIEKSLTLAANTNDQTLFPAVYSMGHDERSAKFTEGITGPLVASDYKRPTICNQNCKVRRLTPTECERLQGLPDGYTTGGSDSARYKALGNGMAQPCADFVISRIEEVEGK